MLDSDVTRRRFMAHFAGAGLGTTLLPGALWAKMQEAGGEEITVDMMSDALALAGLEFDEEEREAMLEAVNDRLSDYEELHELKIPNDISPPFHFSPLVPGMEIDRTVEPFRINENGMPASMTFYAQPFKESQLLAVARAYQDATGHHLKHPDLDSTAEGAGR